MPVYNRFFEDWEQYKKCKEIYNFLEKGGIYKAHKRQGSKWDNTCHPPHTQKMHGSINPIDAIDIESVVTT